ncbi:hypothetical protein [Paracoccus sp. DMF]|uniref:hypothetical protein n=1 Tax=Paracoccus sp. DMF TaxID=400837 RepID=UPI0011006587|nr:hypothetical protein [Paracoccus sp. DMF]MCV2448137.1 hypothetical protein [Paracoccus sp. DMF]
MVEAVLTAWFSGIWQLRRLSGQSVDLAAVPCQWKSAEEISAAAVAASCGDGAVRTVVAADPLFATCNPLGLAGFFPSGAKHRSDRQRASSAGSDRSSRSLIEPSWFLMTSLAVIGRASW